MEREVRPVGKGRSRRSKAVDGLPGSRIRVHGGREEQEDATGHGSTTQPLRTATGRPALLSCEIDNGAATEESLLGGVRCT